MENRSDVNRWSFYTLKLLYGFHLGTNKKGTAVVNTSGHKIMEQHFGIFYVQKLVNNITKLEKPVIDSMIGVLFTSYILFLKPFFFFFFFFSAYDGCT